MMRFVWLAALLVTLSGCPARQSSGETPGLNSSVSGGAQTGPGLTLLLDNGNSAEVSSWRGRAVLIVALRMEDLRSQLLIRDLERIATEHPDGLVVVALFGDDHAFQDMRTLVPTYASVLGVRRVLRAIADESVRAGQTMLGEVSSVPMTFLVNRTGTLVRRVEGLLSYAQLREIVSPAIPPGL